MMIKIKYKPIVCMMSIAVIAAFYIVAGTGCGKSEKTITIGIAQWVSNAEFEKNVEGFKAGMADGGYNEGVNVRYIIENPQADKKAQHEIITAFIDKEVDLIYSLTTPGTLIAKELTSDIPIVFSVVTFPVEAKLIESLESSENNLVGTRNYITPARQYYAFEQVYSEARALAFVHRKGEPNSIIQYQEYKKLLSKRKVEVIDIAASDIDDLLMQLESKKDIIDSLYSACDTLIQSGGEEVVIAFGRRYGKPVFTCNKDGVNKGALIGNVADFYSIGKVSGEKAALILNGASPTQIMTESPRDDYVILNAETASQLGITLPADLLNEVEEVIAE